MSSIAFKADWSITFDPAKSIITTSGSSSGLNNSKKLSVELKKSGPSIREKGAKVYEIEGPLFFSSTDSFLELFKPEEDPEVVIIDFAGSKVIDQSALKAIEDIADKYNSFGKKVKLRHLTRDCHRLLSRAGQLVVDSDDDPDYGIAVDYDVKLGIFGN